MSALRSAILACLPPLLLGWAAIVPAAAAIRTVPSAAYPTIQSAVTASAANDTISILAGEYREHVTIPPAKSGLTIAGQLVSGGVCPTSPSAIVDGGTAGDVFDVQAARVTFRCVALRHGSRGINSSADYLTVSQVRFSHNGSTGVLTTGGGAKILYSSFVGTRGNAISISGSDGLIQSNVIKNADSSCIFIDFLAERTIVTSNTISFCDGEGILAKAANLSIQSNVIDATDNVAISLSTANDSIVTSNKITNTRNAGIFFSGDRGHIRTNQVEASSNEGIFLEGNDAEVKANVVRTAGLGGEGRFACISIQGDRPTIDGNTASVCGYSGIETRGQDPIVKNNRADRLNGQGLGIDVFCNQGTTSGRLESNTATGSNGYDGIFVMCPNVPGFVVLKNTATSNIGYGFELFLDDSFISENVGSQNGGFRENGFYILGDRNTITKNVANDNVEDGYYICGGSNTILYNQARRNQDDGLVLDCGIGNTIESSTIQWNEGEGFVIQTAPNTLRSNVSLNNRQMRLGMSGDCTNDSGGPLILSGNTCVDGSNFMVPSEVEN